MDPERPTLLWKLAAKVQAVRELIEERDALKQECGWLRDQRDTLTSDRDELKRHIERLSAEVGRFTELSVFQGRELEVLRRQRDDLARERDELIEHAQRLLAEVEVCTDRELRLQEESQSLFDQRDRLEVERDELKEHGVRLIEERGELLSRLEAVESSLGSLRSRLWTEPGHFYSPVVDPGEERVRNAAARALQESFERREDLVLDEGRMVELFDRISEYYDSQPFRPAKLQGTRYYFENPMFSYADAITLYGFLRHFKPRRLIEVGCGFSSCAVMDANDLFFDGTIDTSFFDPNPESLLSLLESEDKYLEKVYRLALQEIPLDVFTLLDENDILFLDSSHVAKTASDVIDYLFRVLPALKPGVLVHIHDVPYPFEYPAEWIVDENRSWNESYFVRAFLQYNRSFEVVYWNGLVYSKYGERTAEKMPMCLRNTGGSIWLRKGG